MAASKLRWRRGERSQAALADLLTGVTCVYSAAPHFKWDPDLLTAAPLRAEDISGYDDEDIQTALKAKFHQLHKRMDEKDMENVWLMYL